MRILVTGGTGLVGSNIVKALMKDGHEILITGSDAEQKIHGFVGTYLQPGLTGIDWDALGRLDVVFHQAAINDTILMDEREMMFANAVASQTLFEYALKNECKKFVYASSTAVYGDGPVPYKEDQELRPLNPYAKSKARLEDIAMILAQSHPGAVFVGLRYCNVYGPGESHKGKRASMIYQLAQQMKRGNPRLFKYGEQKRDYIYVKDVVQANILAMNAKESIVLNCGFGKATSYNELVAELNNMLGEHRTPEYFDNPIADRYQTHTECDMTRAKETIGFVPTFDIQKGIADYVREGLLA